MTDIALPDSLQAIADIIGAPAALKVAERWGGTRLYVPARPYDDHDLVKLLGEETTRALCESYAGERIEIPKADCWRLSMRNRLILEARAAGQSQAQVARAHGLTERQVRNIEQGIDGNDNQGALF